jgi:hypothetical protein
MRKVHEFQPVHQPDPAVSEIEQKRRGTAKGRAVVHIEPTVGQGDAAGPPMHHKGQTNVVQQGDPGVIHARRVDNHTVDSPAGAQGAIHLFFGCVLDNRQDHFIAVAGIGIAGAVDEVGKDRVHHLVLCRGLDDVADGQRPARCQPLGTGRGAIVMLLCSMLDPASGCLADLGVAVQCPAHSGLTQPQFVRKFFQIHRHGGPKRFQIVSHLTQCHLQRQRVPTRRHHAATAKSPVKTDHCQSGV